MAVSLNLLPSCSPPGLSPPKFSLKFRGYNITHNQQSVKNEFMDQKVYSIRNVDGYHDYQYNCDKSRHFERLNYKISKCTNTEVSQVEHYSTMSTSKKLLHLLKILYAFSRPYAAIIIVCLYLSNSLIAVKSLGDISLPFFYGVLQEIAAHICIIFYVSGINQIYDIEIDKINKPYLPLASGEMSMETGILIVSGFASMALFIAISSGSMPLIWGTFLTFIWYSIYSVQLPYLRWKRSTVATAFIFSVTFGAVLPVSAYLHIQMHALGRQANFPRQLAFATIFLSLFGLVVALFKDITDIEGDQKYGIRSLAAILGPKKILWMCVYLFEIGYIVAITFGMTSAYTWSKLIIVLSHAILSIILWKRANTLDLNNKSSIHAFYVLLWKLVGAECLLIPLVR